MSVQFVPVIWNRNKWIYDAVLLIGVVFYIYLYLRVGPSFSEAMRNTDGAILRMRAFGSLAFLMLSMILAIGPLARLDPRYLPLLYNRRHFGVLTAGIACVHATYVIGWYFAFSPTDPYVALLGSNDSFTQLRGFPFEVFGMAALFILLILATTSHDFWLSFLTPPVWKTLHMGIYAAYGFVAFHIGLGAFQTDRGTIFPVIVLGVVTLVSGLHFMAARRDGQAEIRLQAETKAPHTGWVRAGAVADIPDKRAITVDLPDGDRVAIFRYDGKLSAVTNACAHQNGPLGEGKILGGAITCPWHGYQYRPEDGCAPAPFTEKIATYRLMLDKGVVYVEPEPLAPGTRIEPLRFQEANS
ncbi:Rieske 2Fe-2S domain-containing protein [Roseibium algae]|uniref:Rieske 2Fe-2S domain-containing protein n=1 Tax=Roseibium algae TaxID=3123038 RepID=A0ABU8TQT8_9HYPH